MPMADQPTGQAPGITALLAPLREAQAALARTPGLGMGSAMEQAFADLVGKLDAEPVAAGFQPLSGQKAGRAPGAAKALAGESVAAVDQGLLAGLTQDLMAQAFAQAMTEATRQRREVGQTQALAGKAAQPAKAPGAAAGFGVLGQVNLGQALGQVLGQALGAAKPEQGRGTGQVAASAKAQAASASGQAALLRPQLGQAMASAMASVATTEARGPAAVPVVGAWQALRGIDALVKELARLEGASAGQAVGSSQPALNDGATARQAREGGAASSSRFPSGFDVQAGRSPAEIATSANPSLLGEGMGKGNSQGSRDASNFDSVPGNAGTGGLFGELANLVSSVWPPLQEALQQAGASKAGARGGLVLPQRTGSAMQGGAAAPKQAESRSVAPRSASMLAPAGLRSASSPAQPDATGGKVLAAVRVHESANDALNPTSPGAAPTAGSATASVSDDALAEQLNRALIEQAWRSGVDLS